MPKEYKRKRLAEEWSLDIRPTAIKKQINSSERWRGKREIELQVQEELDNCYGSEAEDKHHREVKEYEESTPCVDCLLDHACLDKLGQTFYRMGYVVLTWYGRNTRTCKHKQP